MGDGRRESVVSAVVTGASASVKGCGRGEVVKQTGGGGREVSASASVNRVVSHVEASATRSGGVDGVARVNETQGVDDAPHRGRGAADRAEQGFCCVARDSPWVCRD